MSTAKGEKLILAIRGPGDVLGDLSVLDAHPRSATASALVPAQATVIAGDRFRRFLAERPAAGAAYMRNLGARLRDADSERRALATSSVLQRLAARLVELADRQGEPAGSGTVVRPALSQHELAASIGATREAVAKGLRTLREREIVQTGPRQLVVRRRDLLDAIANAPSSPTV